MVPAEVTESDVLAIWTRLNKSRSRVRTVGAKFRVGQHIISKEKMKFAKGSEQNFSDEIFRINKVIYRTP